MLVYAMGVGKEDYLLVGGGGGGEMRHCVTPPPPTIDNLHGYTHDFCKYYAKVYKLTSLDINLYIISLYYWGMNLCRLFIPSNTMIYGKTFSGMNLIRERGMHSVVVGFDRICECAAW